MKTRLGILAVPLTTVLLLVGPSFARDQTSRAGSSGREKRVQKLLATIRDASLRETDPDRVFEAIDELGDMRAVEAVDDLVGLLTLRRSFPWEKDPTQPIDQESGSLKLTTRSRWKSATPWRSSSPFPLTRGPSTWLT
jgi:hypothetical protein